MRSLVRRSGRGEPGQGGAAILLAAPGAARRGDRGASPRPDVLRASAKHRWLPTRFPGRGSGSGAVAEMGAVSFTLAAIPGESLATWRGCGRGATAILWSHATGSLWR